MKAKIDQGLEELKKLHSEIESLTLPKAAVTFAANAVNTAKTSHAQEATQPSSTQGTSPPTKPQNK